MVIFKFNQTEYEILPQEHKTQTAEWHLDQLEFAKKTHQYITIKNRIRNGLKNGWMREISKN